jgi:hypothetical protein
MARKFHPIGETDRIAAHVVTQRAFAPRVEIVWRKVAMMDQTLPAWVREIEATEYETYSAAVAAARRVLAADFAA